MKARLFLILSLLLAIQNAAAEDFKTVLFEYSDAPSRDATALEGSLVYDAALPGKRPVVVIFHDWMGPTAVTLDAAKKVAADGYIAFIADIYGKGVRPQSVKEASEQSGKLKADRALMVKRAQAAMNVLVKIPALVPAADVSKVGAIGFCFGGTVALELARSGALILGTVSFHGGLDTPDASKAKNIKGRVLALHGADDPFVPEKDVSAFENEMRSSKADWQLVKFGGAMHAFTNKEADSLALSGVAYNAKADARSFEYMKEFFAEVFGS